MQKPIEKNYDESILPKMLCFSSGIQKSTIFHIIQKFDSKYDRSLDSYYLLFLFELHQDDLFLQFLKKFQDTPQISKSQLKKTSRFFDFNHWVDIDIPPTRTDLRLDAQSRRTESFSHHSDNQDWLFKTISIN
jgi:hypothetical protein